MSYFVTIHKAQIYIEIQSKCQIVLYSINKGVKRRLKPNGNFNSNFCQIQGIQQFQINHQTLILDVIMLRNSNSKGIEKKKAGYVVVHLSEYEQNKIIELSFELKDCIIKDAVLDLNFQYKKKNDSTDIPPFKETKTGIKQLLGQKQKYLNEENIKLKQKVQQLKTFNQKQAEAIKDLQQKLQDSKFEHQQQVNKTKRIEDLYKRQKFNFEHTNEQLKSQLIIAKNQLTQIMDILNERGEASILEIIEDLISK